MRLSQRIKRITEHPYIGSRQELERSARIAIENDTFDEFLQTINTHADLDLLEDVLGVTEIEIPPEKA